MGTTASPKLQPPSSSAPAAGRGGKVIAFVEGEEKLKKKKKPTKKQKPEGPGGSERGNAEHAGTADLLCSRGGDNAGKRTSISAHPPPFLVRPAKFLGEGRCYLPPASLAGARLLRRAARGSGPAGVAVVPGVRPPAARPNPPGGAPRVRPSISAASLPMTQHPPAALPLPPGARESPPRPPAPPARSAGCSPKMQREAGHPCGWLLRRVGDSQNLEFAFQVFGLTPRRLRERFAAREKPGFACTTRWEAAEGRLW